eukprot:gene7661-7864_t
MKRDADDAAAVSKTKRKKGDAASAGDMLRKDQRQAQHAATASFDTAAWAGQTMATDLADTLTKLYHQAMQPSEDGCWQYIGLPMPKDAVFVHYDDRPGFFQSNIQSLGEFDKRCKQDSAQVPLFHFEAMRMDDADTNEHFEVRLGDYVIIKQDVVPSSRPREASVQEELIGRVAEIFITAQGTRMVAVHWMYRDLDTPIAVALKAKEQGKAPQGTEYQRELPVGGHMSHPRRLWLCGSMEDNRRYAYVYDVAQIDRPCRVFHVRPGVNDPSEVDELAETFDPTSDFFYNQYTVSDYMTFEDCYEDYLPWSAAYKRVWEEEGVEGIRRLKGGKGVAGLSQLMRGASKKQLNRGGGHRRLHAMELFCGGGGLSYICQRNENVTIKAMWANDINNSAAATYSLNHPSAFMSAGGLEEYTQLCMKWGKIVPLYFGSDWRTQLQELLSLPPGKRFSRQHMPRGVGCFGNTLGASGSSADDFLGAASRGAHAVDEARAADPSLQDDEDEDEEVEQPDWDGLLGRFAQQKEIQGSIAGYDRNGLPAVPSFDHTPAEETAEQRKKRKQHEKCVLEAHAKAVEVQKQRIKQCEDHVKEEKLGKVLEVRDVRITDCAVRVKLGSSKQQLPEILTDWECWLEFEVRRENSAGGDGWAWEHQQLLRGAVQPMRRFMLHMLADKTIPMPGDVQLLTGGPPCQNVSGLNRHARQDAVLNDPKNRLVTSYMNIIEYLRPNFILMEQVTCVYRKELGVYGRYTLYQMITLGYQTRSAIVAAGSYGVPQGRKRALFWGALSGVEQLPPFPLPTHNCKKFMMGNPAAAKHCVVDLTQEQAAAAYPMAVAGDILTDLPKLSNFEEGDRMEYLSQPQYVLQQFLRRAPPGHSRAQVLRSAYADAAMHPFQGVAKVAQQVLDKADNFEVLAVGQRVLCRKGGGDSSSKAAAVKDGAGSKSESSAGAAAAAGAATEAGDVNDGDAAGGSEDEDAADDDAGGEEEADGEEEDAADRKAQKNEQQNSKHFALETWNAHLHATREREGDEVADALDLIRDAELHNTAWLLGEQRLHLMAEAAKVPAGAPLRDHRALLCNADDYGRMRAVPKEKGANFRDMPGVVTNEDDICCAGSWHAAQYPAPGKQQAHLIKQNVAAWRKLSKEEQADIADTSSILYKGVELVSSCKSVEGGMRPKPPKSWKGSDGNDKHNRVDSYGSKQNRAWRGSYMEGCDSLAFFLNTGDLVCPRWCVTYKNGKSQGRHGCFGRFWLDQIQQTVVTRAEPHNLEVIHPQQDRVLSIRENARSQGFPDYHVFVGLAAKGQGKNGHGKGAATENERYMQIGNAVAPPLAAALGRCLLLACEEAAPIAEGVVAVPDPDYTAAVALCAEKDIGHYIESNPVDQDADSSLRDTSSGRSTGEPMAATCSLPVGVAAAAHKVLVAGVAAATSVDFVDDTVAVADASAEDTGMPDAALQLQGVASAARIAVSTIEEDAVTSPVKRHVDAAS